MEEDLDANVIRNTQLSLGKYVKRPPLSDKLLRKPPFRFLHDIVTSVLKSTGFFEGLFDENEITSENVKDRESKISFLNKVISVVSLATDKPISAKPSKIVAGQEPEKTNELLQCLAYALDNNLSSDEAVKQFKNAVQNSHSTDKKNKESVKHIKKNIESKKLTSKSSEKLGISEKDGSSINKLKNKESFSQKKESPPKKSLSKISNKKPTEKPNQESKKNNVNEHKNISGKQKLSDNNLKLKQQDLAHIEKTVSIDKEQSSNEIISHPDINFHRDLSNVEIDHLEKKPVSDISENIQKPISAHKSMPINVQLDQSEITKETDIGDRHSLSIGKVEIVDTGKDIKSQSTNSEDTGASAVLQKNSEESDRNPTINNTDKKDFNSSNVIRPSSVRPSSSRPGAPRIRDKSDNILNDTENILGKVNIITENTVNEEDEDTSIIIENNLTEDLHEPFRNQENTNFVNKNSHLVQQILDSQREFSQTSGKTEIEWQFEAQKAPDIFVQEMEQLKFNVQALSRIANPLGKLLDHIQEDVEVMRQELQQWTQVYEETSKDLRLQKNANKEALLPFHTKLNQLIVDMEERHIKISDLKIAIYKNDSRIEKLLSNNNVQ